MDIRVLKYFLEIAREENITRAAKNLHIAQPSLSKQIMELEAEIGKQLLIRGRRKIVLTEEGILLRKRAEEIVALMEKTEKELTSDITELSGDLYIGGSATESIIRTAVQFRNNNKNVQFHIYSGDAYDVLERLDHGNMDFAVTLKPVDVDKYNYVILPDVSEWGLLVNNKSELATHTYVTPEILLQEPVIIHQRYGLQQQIAEWAGVDIKDLNIAATYNVVHGSPVLYVKEGLGSFLTTKDLLSCTELNNNKEVTFIPLKPALSVRYALIWKKNAVFSKLSEAFLESVKRQQEEYDIQ